jgi:hypothetical protein
MVDLRCTNLEPGMSQILRQDQPTYHARSGSEESSRGSNEQLGQLVGPINHDVVAAVDAVRVPGRIGLALRQPLVEAR